ncbi:hypothetical protein D3C76_984590 [compost metagenome]
MIFIILLLLIRIHYHSKLSSITLVLGMMQGVMNFKEAMEHLHFLYYKEYPI